MKASLILFLLLGIVITTLAAGKTTASRRNTRQAGRCSGGQQCILLSSCPDLLTLLNPPTPAGIRRLQGLICAFDRRNPKVCCDAPTVENPEEVTPKVDVAPDPDTSESEPSNLLPEHCGGDIGEKVFGGEEVPLGGYPWMALLGYTYDGNRRMTPQWECGGSLISKRYVVTAAHCLDKKYTRGLTLVKVRLGEHDISEDQDCEQTNFGKECAPPVEDFIPEHTIMHPDWDKRTSISDDIALIRLDRQAEFNSYVNPICLPPSDLDVSQFLLNPDGILRNASVAGWGRWGWTRNKEKSNVRLMVQVPFVPLEKCKLVNVYPLLDKGQLCFGGEEGKDSCKGDSGGPLLSTDLNANSRNLHVLIGVVSYGRKLCGTENHPAVYTDVAQYRDWIVSNLKP